jgi:hypothetical protein
VILALHGDADCLEQRSGGVFYTADWPASMACRTSMARSRVAAPYFGAPPEFSPVVVE